MTLTFGIAIAATAGPGAAGRTGTTLTGRRATPETITASWAGRSTTTSATTPTAGTRRGSAARRPATRTVTRPGTAAAAAPRVRPAGPARPPGQGQGQLVAPLDLAEGPGCRARRRRRVHHPGRRRDRGDL